MSIQSRSGAKPWPTDDFDGYVKEEPAYITILCYAPSVITCTVGGAIQMTVYITLHYILLARMHYTLTLWLNKLTTDV